MSADLRAEWDGESCDVSTGNQDVRDGPETRFLWSADCTLHLKIAESMQESALLGLDGRSRWEAKH